MVGEKKPALQVLEIYAVVSAYGGRAARLPLLLHLPLLLQAPPLLAARTSGRFKGLGWVPHVPFPHFSFLISPFGARH